MPYTKVVSALKGLRGTFIEMIVTFLKHKALFAHMLLMVILTCVHYYKQVFFPGLV